MPRWLFAVLVLAVLQLLLWVFARSLRFLWGDTRRRWLTAAVFVAGDGLSLLAFSRLFPPLFIAQAWLVALLWLWFMAAVAGFVLYRCARPFAPEKAATALRVFLPTAFAALFAWGFFNANSTVVRHETVVLDKPLAQPLRIGVATDLHLDSGFFFGARELDRLAAIFAAEQVDIILLPGDIINDKPEAFYAEYLQHIADHTRWFPGMEDLLAALEARGVLWGVVTNKLERFTYAIARHFGFELRAAALVCGDTLAVGKPDPAPLVYACSLAGVRPERCIMIGDSNADVQAASRAGMPSIYCDYGYTSRSELAADDRPLAFVPDVAALRPYLLGVEP